jgi:hypothetical protein
MPSQSRTSPLARPRNTRGLTVWACECVPAPIVKFMVDHLEKRGCKVSEKDFFVVRHCDEHVGGGFDESASKHGGVVLCQNHIRDFQHTGAAALPRRRAAVASALAACMLTAMCGSRDDAHARARARVRSLPRVRGLEQLRAPRLQRSAGGQPQRRLQNVSIDVQAHAVQARMPFACRAGGAQATDMLCALRCNFTSQGIKNFCGVILRFGGKAWRVFAGARPCRFP